MIQISRCSESQVPALMTFIDTHWRKNHTLATSRPLMDWQHRDENAYNYLLAWHDETLLGVLGYIPSRRYDPALVAHNVLWLALWKIRDDCKITGLGLRMLKALEQLEPHEAIAVNGTNHSHPPMYKALGFTTAELTQHYIVNPAQPRYLLQGQGALPYANTGSATATKLDETTLRTLPMHPTATPQKTPRYFIERFLHHPFYRYNVWLLKQSSRQALIATRIAQHENRNAMRIVDIAGDIEILAHSGSALLSIMQQNKAEYADFWQHGIDNSALAQAGFGVVKASVIVPNFYEPYIAQNSRILCAYKSTASHPVVICRADGDQDRPNVLTT
jgi:hypothetical protein